MDSFQTWLEGVGGRNIYLVLDPTPISELIDILVTFDLDDPRGIAAYMMGAIPLDNFMKQNPTFHTDPELAKADADRRMIRIRG